MESLAQTEPGETGIFPDYLLKNGSLKMEKIITSISKTVKGRNGEANKREKIGDVEYLQPTLADFGIAGTEVRDEKTNELIGYTEKVADWLFSAIYTATRAALTTRLDPQAVTYRAGQSAWTNLDELVTPTGGAKGAHFTIKKDFKEAFNAFIDSLGKSAGFTANIKTLAVLPIGKDTQPALAAIDAGTKKVFKKYLDLFVASLGDDDVMKFQGILTDLDECCTVVNEGLEDE